MKACFTVFLSRHDLSSKLDEDVCQAIKSMESLASMRVMGDKLVRDRLSAMTLAFHTPLAPAPNSGPNSGSGVGDGGAGT